MTEEVEQKRPTLEGEAALRLWRQGPDAWNSWIDQHPGWNISFEGVDFSTERDPYGNLSFADYHFGDGNVNFSNATFGKGDVDFSMAIFGNGDVNFQGITFGSSNVLFVGTHFGDGIVTFSWSNFGSSNVVFTWATFGKCKLFFSEVTVGNGEVKFDMTSFGNSTIAFDKANLEKLTFSPTKIETSYIEAEGLSIKGRAIFSFATNAALLKSFNLHSASFDGPLTITGDISTIPDLRATPVLPSG